MAEKVSSSWPGVEVQSAGRSRDADTPLDSEVIPTRSSSHCAQRKPSPLPPTFGLYALARLDVRASVSMLPELPPR
jgi:hypothetical protein